MHIRNVFTRYVFFTCLISMIATHCIDFSTIPAEENHSVLFMFVDHLILDMETVNEQMRVLDNQLNENVLEQSEEEYSIFMRIYEDATRVIRQGCSLLPIAREYYMYDKKYEKSYRCLAQKIFSLQKKINKIFTRANVFPGIFHNDAAGIASSSLIINADIDPAAAIVDTKLATISTAGKVANSATTATSSNTASTIVLRDGSGNFTAGTITASLNGNATSATATTNFSGSLSGDVTGTQGATVVSVVGGQSASSVASSVTIVSQATNENVTSTLVLRDNSGSFSAQTISMVDGIVSGHINLPETASLSVGTIQQDGSRLLHTYGTNNTFFGQNAGNFTLSGTGGNSGVGSNVLQAHTTGEKNTAMGASAGSAITTGSNNVLIGHNIAGSTTTGNNNIYVDGNDLNPANENNTIRIGNTQTACYVQGIAGTIVSGNVVIVDPATGQLGTLISSERFKYNIKTMTNEETHSLYDLRPVTFIYKEDAEQKMQYGLIAEEVNAFFPDLVIRDTDGLPYSVRYEILPALLLQELQHHKAIIDGLINNVEQLNIYVCNLASQIASLRKNN